MAIFAEDIVQEYPQMVKRQTESKTVSYRIRVVRRKVDGIMRKLVDIREFLVNDRKALFTESGVYFNAEELGQVLKTLHEIQDTHFRKE